MKIRRIRIWLSRGWYRVVYSVSFLVLSFLCSCSSSKTVAKEKTGGSKGVETSKDKEPVDSTKTDVSVIKMEDFEGLGIETPDIRLMYGVPRPVLQKENLSGRDEMTEVADGSELADSIAVVFDSIRLDTEYLRTHMRLRNGILPPVSREEYAPLIIYDGNPVEVDKEKYAAFDWDKDIYSKKKVAALLGVKKKAVKASRVVTDRAAVAIWGSRGRNGTFEVISYDAEEYNRLATNNFFQPLK